LARSPIKSEQNEFIIMNWNKRYASEEGEFGETNNSDQHIIKIPCQMCGVDQHISVSPEQKRQLELPGAQRPLIQDLLPHHSLAERELFLSGICGRCFDKIFQ